MPFVRVGTHGLKDPAHLPPEMLPNDPARHYEQEARVYVVYRTEHGVGNLIRLVFADYYDDWVRDPSTGLWTGPEAHDL